MCWPSVSGCVDSERRRLRRPAGAPSEASASETISQLQSEGYRVILSKVGTKGIDECTVSAVRRGHSVTGPQIPVGAAGVTSFNPGQNLQYDGVRGSGLPPLSYVLGG